MDINNFSGINTYRKFSDRPERKPADGVKHDNSGVGKAYGRTKNDSFARTMPEKSAAAYGSNGVGGVAVVRNPNGISEAAQAVLDELKEKYGDISFKVASFDTDDEANAILDNMQTEKKYNCVITPDALEKMAADENEKLAYMNDIEESVQMVEDAYTELGENNPFDKIGVARDENGNKILYGTADLKDGEIHDKLTVKAKTVSELLEKLDEQTKLRQEMLDEMHEKRREEEKAEKKKHEHKRFEERLEEHKRIMREFEERRRKTDEDNSKFEAVMSRNENKHNKKEEHGKPDRS